MATKMDRPTTGQTVAEEPLGDERARGQNLDAAVVVQGVLLLLRVLVLRNFRSWVCSLLSLRNAHARIDHAVQNIGQQVAGQRQHRHEGQVEHRERDVARDHGLVRDVADARDGEQCLGDEGAAEQAGQAAADDRDQRDQRVAEGVLIDDRALRQALGAGRADVVGVQDLEHVRAGIAHVTADGDNDQRDDGQDQMVGLVQELAHRIQLGVIASDEAVQVEPAELDREEQLEQRGKGRRWAAKYRPAPQR